MFSNDYIVLTSGIFWFVSMIVHHDSNLKYFLAVLGATNFASFLAQTFFNTDPTYLFITGLILSFYSFQSVPELRQNWKSNLSVLLFPITFGLIMNNAQYVLPILSFTVLWKLQKISVIDYLQTNKINFFYLALVVYQITVVLYNVILIVDTTYLSTINYIFSICQIFVIVFCLLFKKSERPMIAKLSLSP